MYAFGCQKRWPPWPSWPPYPPVHRPPLGAFRGRRYDASDSRKRSDTMIGRHMGPKEFLNRVGEELGKIDPGQVKTLSDWIWDVYQAGRFVFVIGNGGSGSNASHFCEDMGKG